MKGATGRHTLPANEIQIQTSALRIYLSCGRKHDYCLETLRCDSPWPEDCIPDPDMFGPRPAAIARTSACDKLVEGRRYITDGNKTRVERNTHHLAECRLSPPREFYCRGRHGGPLEFSICTEEFIEGEVLAWLPCRHAYHVKCIMTWLRTESACPFCKDEVYEAMAEAAAGHPPGAPRPIGAGRPIAPWYAALQHCPKAGGGAHVVANLALGAPQETVKVNRIPTAAETDVPAKPAPRLCAVGTVSRGSAWADPDEARSAGAHAVPWQARRGTPNAEAAAADLRRPPDLPTQRPPNREELMV